MSTARSDPTVSVVVVSYNTASDLRRCLRSVSEVESAVPTETIVVDNASTDGSEDLVRSEFPDVRLVAAGANLGFAAGVALGARNASGEYLLLLNPDAILHDRTVDALVDSARRDPTVGIVGGRALTPDGDLDPRSCWGTPTVWSLFCFATGLSTAFAGSARFDPESLGPWRRDTERGVPAVSGALMLVDAGLWRDLGGFDADYFMYSEDIDLCVRAAAAGRRCVVNPDAVVTHRVGAASTTPDKWVMVLAGKVTYVRKHWGRVRRRVATVLLLGGACARAAAARAVRSTGARQAWPEVWRRRAEWRSGYPTSGDRD